MNEPENKPAPSEDEKEKLGERLFDLRTFIWPGFKSWKETRLVEQKEFVVTALRFRAECIVPYAAVIDATKALLNLYTQDTINQEEQDKCKKVLAAALSAISVPAPSAPAEPPYRKLIEATREVLSAYRGYGDIAGGTFETDEDRQTAELKVGSEVGGAVEQLADAVEDLSTPDELPNPKSVEEPNMCNRTHIGCFSCPWKDATPPKCKGHPQGPTDCKERPDADSFAQPEPPKPTVSDEIRAAATMLLDGVTRAAGEAAERRIRAVLEGK